MSNTSEGGTITGTADKDYNLIWFAEQCLNNALRLETYIADAERGRDTELTDLFRRAQDASRRGAEEAKRLLGSRLSADTDMGGA
jgi:hypothetical protein